MIERLARWLDARLHLAKFARRAMDHVFPDHWSFMLGEIALYSFVILVITGTFLATLYHGSSATVVYHGSYRPLDGVQMSAAYQSGLKISLDVPGGLLVRQMHHWAALLFLASILTHACRIFFTAAYRKPREINWIIGVTLLLLAIVNGFLGYSLLDDLLSGIGLRIGYAILLSVPVIGRWLVFVALGGPYPSEVTIPRLYSLHIFLVPALIFALIVLHLGIVWRQMHTNYPGPRRTDRTIVGSRLWPSYAVKSVGLFALVFGMVAMLGGLVQIDPIWVYGPFNPSAAMPGAQPDFYLGWIEGAMRLFPGVNIHAGTVWIPEVFFPAILLPGALFAALYAYPFLEEFFFGKGREHHVLLLPYQQPLNTAIGCSVLMFLLVLLVAGGDDVIAVFTGTSVTAIRTYLRIIVFVAPAVTAVVVYVLCAGSNRRSVRSTPELSTEQVGFEEPEVVGREP